MKTIFQLLIFVPFTILTINCGNAKSENSETQSSDSLITQYKNDEQSEKPTFEFPKNVEILLHTQYRKESTGYPKNVKDKEWYELYKDAKTGKWNIGKADLTISYGRDECVDEDIMIINSRQADAVLFFTPFENLSKNPVTVLEDKMLFPMHNISFDFNHHCPIKKREGFFI